MIYFPVLKFLLSSHKPHAMFTNCYLLVYKSSPSCTVDNLKTCTCDCIPGGFFVYVYLGKGGFGGIFVFTSNYRLLFIIASLVSFIIAEVCIFQ